MEVATSLAGQTVPMITQIVFGLGIAVCFLLPVILLILVKRKSGISIMTFFCGILVFFLFSTLLESMCHGVFLGESSPFGTLFTDNPILYALYVGLAAGIFEETGRYVAFRFFLKNDTNKKSSLIYGLGHGGIEMIMIGGVGFLSVMSMSLLVNQQGVAQILAQIPADSIPAYEESLTQLFGTSGFLYFMTILERVMALTIQLSLSVLVFYAVRKKQIKVFLGAIGLHALSNAAAGLYQAGLVTNVYLMEGIMLIITAGIVYIAYQFYKKYEVPADTKQTE